MSLGAEPLLCLFLEPAAESQPQLPAAAVAVKSMGFSGWLFTPDHHPPPWSPTSTSEVQTLQISPGPREVRCCPRSHVSRRPHLLWVFSASEGESSHTWSSHFLPVFSSSNLPETTACLFPNFVVSSSQKHVTLVVTPGFLTHFPPVASRVFPRPPLPVFSDLVA